MGNVVEEAEWRKEAGTVVCSGRGPGVCAGR